MQHLRYCTLFTLFCIGLSGMAQHSSPHAYHVTGRCHDYSTALGLNATIYAIIDGQRKLLGAGENVGKLEAQTGKFDVLLPATATHVVLEMAGYHTVTVAVHFTPGIPNGTSFAFYNLASMTQLDTPPTSVPSALVDFISLAFIETDSIANGTWLDLSSPKSSKRIIMPTLDASGTKMMHFPLLAGDYVSTLSTSDGRAVSTDRFHVSTGVTFKAIYVSKRQTADIPKTTHTQCIQPQPATIDSITIAPAVVSNVPSITAPSTTTLYFDQSSYTLRTQALPTLDSLADVLTSKPLQVTLTGYTDNVGARTPNVTLSEYRTRTVATYLTQRGVPVSRLVTQWKGPDSTATTDAPEAIKAGSRRVEVRVAPRQ